MPQAAAALSFELSPLADGAQLLIPDGQFRATDGSGRPSECPCWTLDAAAAQQVIALRAERGVDLVIDYEHATLLKAKAGDVAPAAGWVKPAALEYRPGVGLVARSPEWTPRARGYLDAREYRYGSPVILYDAATGHVTGLHSFALTNDPGLSGVNAALAAPGLALLNNQESPVNETLKKLLALLGLAESADEPAVLAAVTSLKTKADGAEVQIAALRAAPPDATKWVPMTSYTEAQTALAAARTELAALMAHHREAEVDALLDKHPGKVTPAVRDHFRGLGIQNMDALKAVLAALPDVTALGGASQTGGKAPAGGGVAALSATEAEVCRAMGIAEADYIKTKGAAQ